MAYPRLDITWREAQEYIRCMRDADTSTEVADIVDEVYVYYPDLNRGTYEDDARTATEEGLEAVAAVLSFAEKRWWELGC